MARTSGPRLGSYRAGDLVKGRGPGVVPFIQGARAAVRWDSSSPRKLAAEAPSRAHKLCACTGVAESGSVARNDKLRAATNDRLALASMEISP